MLREIVTPKTQDYTVKIPLEYLNTKVEILVLPFLGMEKESSSKETLNLKQLLKKYPINNKTSLEIDSQINELRNEWN